MLDAVDTTWVHNLAGLTFRKQQVTSFADENVVRTGQSVDDLANALVCAQAWAS